MRKRRNLDVHELKNKEVAYIEVVKEKLVKVLGGDYLDCELTTKHERLQQERLDLVKQGYLKVTTVRA